jgi:hypothetical protein
MIRVVALLATSADPGPAGTFRRRVQDVGDDIAKRVAVGQVRVAFVTANGPTETSSTLSVETSQFAAVLEILLNHSDDYAEALAALDGLARRLGPELDRARSTILAGDEEIVVEGQGALQIHVALARPTTLSVEEFHACWREEFGPLAATTPHMAGYRQVHVSRENTEFAARAAGLPFRDFDGIAIEWFPSPAKLQEAATWSEESTEHVRLRQHFIDEPRSPSLLSDNV